MNTLKTSIRKANIVVVFLFLFLISSIALAQGTYAKKIKGAKPSGIIGAFDGGNVLLFDSVLLRKVNASGKKVWQKDINLNFEKQPGGPPSYGPSYGRGVAELSDGGYILTGDQRWLIDTPWFSEGWLVKLTSAGKVDWQKRFVENGSGMNVGMVLSSVVPSTDGGFWAAGSRGKPEFVGFGNGGVIVTSFDSRGKMRWGKVFGDDFFFDLYFLPQLFVTSDQELIVVSQLFSSHGGENLGTLVLKLDADPSAPRNSK